MTRRLHSSLRARRVPDSARDFAAAVLVAALLLAPPALSPAAAQDGADATLPPSGTAAAPEGAAARVAGFWGVPWGADSAAVASALGPPIVAADRGRGMRAFVYTVFHLGKDGFLHMWVLEGRGLVRGVYVPVVDDCSYMLRRMVQQVRERHPAVEYATRGRVAESAGGKDVCEAAMDGEADFAVVWEDSAGHRVSVGAEPGEQGIRMTASTPAYRAWREGG